VITIPTGELTGVLSDVIPFASPDEELPDLNCVRLEWAGDMLHAFSHDLIRSAWSQWSPDDPPPPGLQDPLGVDWGGTDEPWGLTLALCDAREIVSIFKLPGKERQCPLVLDLLQAGRLKVVRSRETSRSAVTGVWEDTAASFTDVRAQLTRWDRVKAVKSIAFNAALLADFEVVRPRGPLRLTFTGEETPTLVEIGERFVGAIMPVRTERRSAGLRTASGLHVKGSTQDGAG